MKTTITHFATFKKECLRLQKEWGLLDWELNFEHAPTAGALASCQPCFGSREVFLKLHPVWGEKGYPPTHENICETAKHEMIHVLLAPLEDLVAKRYITKDMENDAGHAVLIRLMKLL